MLLFVVAHKVIWFSVLIWFCNVIVCRYSKSVMVECLTLFCDVIVCYCSQMVMVYFLT